MWISETGGEKWLALVFRTVILVAKRTLFLAMAIIGIILRRNV